MSIIIIIIIIGVMFSVHIYKMRSCEFFFIFDICEKY